MQRMRRFFLGAIAAALCALSAPAQAQTVPNPHSGDVSDVSIPTEGLALSARLYAPLEQARYPIVVLVAGSGNESTIGGVYTQIIARAFNARGIGVLAYDKRGVGQSGGTYTGGDFPALGADAADVVRYAQALPQTESVGLWGISQAGWIIPYALRELDDVRFAILVSPAGVNPHEQVSHFLHRQALSWGLNADEAAAADRMHRAVALYYAGRASHRSAQAEVDSHRDARWFAGVIAHPYWDEISAEGAVLTPAALRAALHDRPGAFEIYRERSSFLNYAPIYRALRRTPTLVLYGGADELVPVERSRAVFAAALRGDDHTIHVFEGASHDIQTPEGRVLPEYLDMMAEYAARHFAD